MKAWISIVALAAALSFGAASAEAAPSALAKACAKDIKSVCADVKSGGGKLKACVKEHYSRVVDRLSDRDRQGRGGRARLQGGRKEAVLDLKPGKNRVAECLQSHRRRPQ